MLLRFAQSAAAIELSIILGPVISALGDTLIIKIMKYISTLTLIVFCYMVYNINNGLENIYRSLGIALNSLDNYIISYSGVIGFLMVVVSCMQLYLNRIPSSAIVGSIGIPLIIYMTAPIFTETSHFSSVIDWSEFMKFGNYAQPLCIVLVLALWVVWIRRISTLKMVC